LKKIQSLKKRNKKEKKKSIDLALGTRFWKMLLWFLLCGVKFCAYGLLHGFLMYLICWILAYWLSWNWKSLIMSCGLVVNWYMWLGVGIHSWITWFSSLILFLFFLMVEWMYALLLFFARGLAKFWCGGVDNSYFICNFLLYFTYFYVFEIYFYG